MKSFFANKFANTITLLNYLCDKSNLDVINDFIKDHDEILKDTKGIKYDITKLVWLLFGYYKGSKMLKILTKCKTKITHLRRKYRDQKKRQNNYLNDN